MLGGLATNKAAVTIAIDNGEFTPFHANATCAIRPQSLIGEKLRRLRARAARARRR